MNPTAKQLVMDWINKDKRYSAHGIEAFGSAILIKKAGGGKSGFLYLEPIKRWNVEPGIYFARQFAEGLPPIKLPELGDPSYFDALIKALDDAPSFA